VIKIGIIGDLEPERPSHKATNEALHHCSDHFGIDLEIQWLPTNSLEVDVDEKIKSFNGLWCAPGSPYKSMKGALNAIRYARVNDYPFIGTCGGFQHAAIEYVQNHLGLVNVQHEEYDPFGSNFFITTLSCSLLGETRRILLNKNSLVYTYYNEIEIEERYNCNFGMNVEFQKLIDESGFTVAGTDENGEARILELTQNRFYVATLYQPQLSSTLEKPHKLIIEYFRACMKFKYDD